MSLQSHANAVHRHVQQANDAKNRGDMGKYKHELRHAKVALDKIQSCGKTDKQIQRDSRDAYDLYKNGHPEL